MKKEGIETTISGVRYVSADVFLNKYFGRNKLYEGYVIGFGYVKIINRAIQPCHLNGFNPEVRMIPFEDTHFEIESKMESDRSPAAVKQSLKPLFVNGETSITVGTGMTLSSIASFFGVTVDDLVRWNNIENPDKIYVGQNIKIVDKSYLPMGNNHSTSRNTVLYNQSEGESFLFSKEMGYISMGLAVASVATSAYQEIPLYSRMASSLSANRFLARYNGKLVSWSNNFNGNGAVSSSVVQANKTQYLRYMNRIKWLRYGGNAAGLLGVGISASQWYEAEDPGKQAEAMFDTFMGGVGFIPGGGWIASGIYSLTAPLRNAWREKVLPIQMEMGIEGYAAVMPFK